MAIFLRITLGHENEKMLVDMFFRCMLSIMMETIFFKVCGNTQRINTKYAFKS